VRPVVCLPSKVKLVLWENVLESLIECAKEDMDAALTNLQSALKTTDSAALVAGWITLWQAWTAKQERLAVYRVLLGEQHKMAASTVALFDQFEAVLESVLTKWLEAFDVTLMALFALKAISKEALLMPALLNQECMKSDDFKKQLEWLVNKK